MNKKIVKKLDNKLCDLCGGVAEFIILSEGEKSLYLCKKHAEVKGFSFKEGEYSPIQLQNRGLFKTSSLVSKKSKLSTERWKDFGKEKASSINEEAKRFYYKVILPRVMENKILGRIKFHGISLAYREFNSEYFLFTDLGELVLVMNKKYEIVFYER